MMAAKNGHLDIVKYFLYPPPALMEIIDPADMEISAEDAASLLVFAATQAPKIGTELIKMLLLFGLNKYLNIQQEETGMTALHAACEVGHLETVKLLLKGKADKMVMDEMGQTPLHKACGSSLECVQYLLGIEVSPTKGLMVRRMSALLDVGLFADAVDTAAKADVDDDELSISGEVDVDASAIQAATSEEKLEAAVQAAAAAELQAESEKVVSKSVDKEFVAMQLTKKDIDGKDCLLIAALAGKPDILAFAREFVPETKEAVVQIASRRASVSSHIGSIVASVDGTALSEDGSLDLAKSPSAELLKSSSQKDVETDAVPKIEKSVSQAAKSEGEDMGWTPNDIHRAFDLAISGPVPCLKIILDFGLDPSWSLEDDGVNMAMVVARAGRLEVLDLLLHKGMDFSAKDTGGRTVMHYAAMCKDAAVVAHLLTHEKAQVSV
jgi:ankyrin repeat protein